MPDKKKIILIDDDEDICFLVKNLLKDDFIIDFSTSGKQGIEKIKSGDYDLILLDIMMPEMNGYEVMNEIKKILNDVPIIFLTAKDSTSDLIIGFKKGAARYITKPIDTEEFIHEIKTTLNMK